MKSVANAEYMRAKLKIVHNRNAPGGSRFFYFKLELVFFLTKFCDDFVASLISKLKWL